MEEGMKKESLGLIFMKGCEEFGAKVEYYLKQWYDQGETNPRKSYRINAECPRFATGEGKGVIHESLRGKDVFILVDPFNYSVEYTMYDQMNRMSPDDHFQDTKRVLSAIAGKAKRITVIMPMLYEGRQHRKASRESLDCAHALQELGNMGVTNIITFDAHDPRVQNAIPLIGFDNMQPKYQMVKAMSREFHDVEFLTQSTLVISPDEGGINRCLSFSKSLGLAAGMFYKRRNLNTIVNGTNPVEKHIFIGDGLEGKDAIVVDDMISSGDSLIDTFRQMKGKGTKRNFAFITFGLFCNGLEKFNRAYEEGLFDKIYVTNLIYNPPELLKQPWISIVDMSKYAAYVIDAVHRDDSVGAIIDPEEKITSLLLELYPNKKKEIQDR
jgi:ribose-phosphate pyrophosphokinase